MLALVGIVVVFAMVFGSYVMAGGNFAIILHAAPHELMSIGGAAVGTFLVANGSEILKGALGDSKRVVAGPKWGKDDYRDLLSLMYLIVKLLKARGVLALEPHLDDPGQSALFAKYPKIRDDHFAIDFITDTLRMMTMSMDDPFQVEECMQRQLKKHHSELHARAAAIQTMADGLPALGIVAAVLGVVKTMGSINAPVQILGEMIGGALVGTFLGVLLAYGLVAPIASRLNQTYEQDGQFYAIIRDCLVAYLQGHSAPVVVELARGSVPTVHQPSFRQMDEVLGGLPSDPLAAAA